MRRPRLVSMVRAPAASVICVTLGIVVTSCGQLPADSVTSPAPIFGGVADTTDDAVMALINQVSTQSTSACSGTTIATVGASGIFLTAGHCVVANDGMGHITTPVKVGDPSQIFIVPGNDWMTSVGGGLYFGVAQVAVHPQYDGAVDSPFDLALVRYLGALPSSPVVPVLAPTDDKLVAGSPITVVGYGKTETNSNNSQRRKVDRVVQSITANQFIYDQTDLKGACQGDSGGPAFFATAPGARVAGITSFGDPDCTKVGASVRVSALSAFVQSFISAAPKTLSCDDCSSASVGPGNACADLSIACSQSTSSCRKFVTCADACSSAACVTQCRHSFASGATAYDAIVACQCGGMCATACATNAVCKASGTGTGGAGTGGMSGTGAAGAGGAGTGGMSGTGGGTGAAGTSGSPFTCDEFTDPQPACASCRQGSCCTQSQACAADGTCSACLVDASSSACRLNAAFIHVAQCLASCPGTPCARSSTIDAGTTGSAGTGPTGKSGCSCDVSPLPARGSVWTALFALAFVVSRSSSRSSRARRR
jgi:hypothetical protein